MIKKTYLIPITFTLCALALCLANGEVFAASYLSKNLVNPFISRNLKKKVYKIEVQTTEFLDRQQSQVNGLVESFRGTSKYAFDIFTKGFCYGSGGVLDCQSFTYDSAVAAMAFTLAGQPQKACKIFSSYKKEFYTQKNEYIGLCNSYRTDAYGTNGLSVGIDGIRIHLGPNMWVSLAILQYSSITDDLQYLGFVIDMVKWVQQLQHWEFVDGQRGGVSMGYGWGPDWTKVFSTENNVDYYAVLSMLRELYISGDSRVREKFAKYNYGLNDIDSEMKGIERWMKEVAYNPEERSFNCGYNDKGAQTTRALDAISWTIAAFGPGKLQEMGIDPFYLMDYAESHFLVINDVMGERMEGFDFTDSAGRNNPTRMIWAEGTGFQTVAYQIMSRYAKSVGRKEKAEEYRLKAIKYSDEIERLSAAVQLVDGALPYTSKCLGEKDILFIFANEWEVPRGNKGQWVASVSSTVWRYYALCGFNPLAFNTEKLPCKIVKLKGENPSFVSE